MRTNGSGYRIPECKQDVIDILEGGRMIEYHAWVFSEERMSCWDLGCCDLDFDDLNEATDTLEDYCNGKWEDCEEC